MMRVEVRDRGRVRVLALAGRLSRGAGSAAALHDDVRRELESGHSLLLLDMRQVGLVDSTGLGVLVSCLTSARQDGGDLKLLGLVPRVADVFEITQADRLFEIFVDEELALRSFA